MTTTPLIGRAALQALNTLGRGPWFNADTNFLMQSIFPPRDPNARFDVGVYTEYVDLLADSGVAVLLMNANAQAPWFPSQAQPSVIAGYRRGDLDFVRGQFPALDEHFTAADLQRVSQRVARVLDRVLDLQEDGADWLATVGQACRRRGLGFWASIRMNDLHGSNSWADSYMNIPPTRDPATRLSGREPDPRDGVARAVQSHSYAHAATRAYYLSLIREQVERYDVDGVELDWVRCPFCLDAPADEAGVALMLDWMRQVRALGQKHASKRGRPVALTLRLPPRLGLLRATGLDVVAMVREGLIDAVAPSNYFQQAWEVDIAQLRAELGEQVALIGVIEGTGNWLTCRAGDAGKELYRMIPQSDALLRGAAAARLACGVDALETFNFFCGDEVFAGRNPDSTQRAGRYATLQQLDQLDTLRGQPKQYLLATQRAGYQFPVYELAEQLPRVLAPGHAGAFRISACAEPARDGLRMKVQVVVDEAPGEDAARIGVSVNGSWPSFAVTRTPQLLHPAGIYTQHTGGRVGYDFDLPSQLLRDGSNEIVIYNGGPLLSSGTPSATQPLRIQSVELAIDAG